MDGFAQIAPFYDWEHQSFQDDIPLYRGFAQRCGGPVLELACGTGRILLPLAAAGFEVEGVDASESMLAILHGKLATAPRRELAHVHHASLTSYRLDRRFAMALIGLDSFGLVLDRADQSAALRLARERLDGGGLLIIDVSNGNTRASSASEELRHVLTAPYPPSGRSLTKLAAVETDVAEQVDRYTYFYDETTESGQVRRTVAALTVRYFARFELELLVERAGFQIEAVYGSYELEPFTASSQRLIAVAHTPR